MSKTTLSWEHDLHGKADTATRLDFGQTSQHEPVVRSRVAKRANELDGATWTRYSLSVWSDIRKSQDEIALRHPAMFPAMLVRRLIQCFTTARDRIVLDPFAGSGSTLVGAMLENKTGVGLEVVPAYIGLAKQRIAGGLFFSTEEPDARALFRQDTPRLLKVVPSVVKLLAAPCRTFRKWLSSVPPIIILGEQCLVLPVSAE
jgi:DNA methylase